VTPAGIVPATFQFVTQHLNDCATAVPATTVFWFSNGTLTSDNIRFRDRRSDLEEHRSAAPSFHIHELYYLRLSRKQLFHNGEHSSSARFSTNEAIIISRRFLQVLQLGYPYLPESKVGPASFGGCRTILKFHRIYFHTRTISSALD